LTGEEHLILDGTPRSLLEVQVLDTAMEFYGRKDIYVIHLEVSRQWSEDRMVARKRADDTLEDIKKRLDWFDKDVAPALDYYRNHPNYKYIKINGERTIEEIKADIQKSL
jgi:adenylate kinase family enzyme